MLFSHESDIVCLGQCQEFWVMFSKKVLCLVWFIILLDKFVNFC